MYYRLNCFALMHLIPIVFCVEWAENKGLYYYISEGERADYVEATQICASMNAHLAVITNNDQNDFLRREEIGIYERWIGMSTKNDVTHHENSECKDKTWFWNTDWHCTNDFTPGGKLEYSTTSKCSGVTARTSIWEVNDCSHKFGFICQWECRKFYFEILLYNDELTGIYEFDSYYNGHVRYRKEGTNGTIRIYKSTLNAWIINNDDKSSTQRARFETDSYVPYGHELSWKTIYPITDLYSSTMCIECARLRMCIPSQVLMVAPLCTTIYLNNSFPEYINHNGNVFLKHYQNSQSCICMPTRSECGQRCEDIFPYPNVNTTVSFLNKETVLFTNLCVLHGHQMPTGLPGITNSPEEGMSSSDIYSQTGTPSSEKNNASPNLTAIVASVVSVVIVIIIVVVVIIVAVLRKIRNRNQVSKSYAKPINNTNQELGIITSNEYDEYDEPTPVDRLEPAYTESAIGGCVYNESETDDQYTYIEGTDLNIKSQITKACDVNHPTAIYAKEKPTDGYLAPDYGILMYDKTKQQITDQPAYAEVKQTYGKTHSSHHDDTYDNDRQILDNDTFNSGNDDNYDTRNRVNAEEYNGRDYYNCETKDDVEDDLELFENTVYNQM